ncbi:hypothetical protein RchiOBHm_Chr6g0285581 [Rosa chinensis]|uniref:Tetraspanin/Peripherin n=1 Tax=Rosa chinensis TaxID=74649 RepID=A0A2P6PUQ1_ROSCH|nr:tetraspanin-18 [Rosa chinensis]PRQ25616.1 hypothetical protein RchiOBHm_Chr6g0285581 [Rosa chinensis]
MPKNCCHVCLAFVLKFLNFLQAFVGVAIIVYSAWMLDQWNHHIPVFPPPSAPSPDSPFSLSLGSDAGAASDQITPLDFAVRLVSGVDDGMGFQLNAVKLPAPWFIYSFMGVGALLCCITFIGCIAAESINGCCLCFYSLLITVLTLVEAALVAFIAIDHHWDKDLPLDPTGELDSLRSFIEENIDICKCVGIAVIGIQALSLLLAIILRGMISTHKPDYDVEDEYDARSRTWEPLLNQQSSQASGSTKGDGRGTHSDIWSSRIRDKYGLSSGDKYNSVNQNASMSMKSRQ